MIPGRQRCRLTAPGNLLRANHVWLHSAVDEELSDFVVNDDEATFVKSLRFSVFAFYLSRSTPLFNDLVGCSKPIGLREAKQIAFCPGGADRR
jgi:hypothetical protein